MAAKADFDVAIVGAGPAGLAAARETIAVGLSTVMIDELPRAGGQFLRPPPKGRRPRSWMDGRLYAPARALLLAVEDHPGATWHVATSLLGLLPDSETERSHRLWLAGKEGSFEITARRVVLATGCHEWAPAFPGWTTPGVMGAGAIQTLIKAGAKPPPGRVVLAGSHPLQLIVADQILAAGGKVAGVFFAQKASALVKFMTHPWVAARSLPQLLAVAAIVARLRRSGVPLRFGHAPVAAVGGEALAAVDIAPLDRDGAPDRTLAQRIEAEYLGLCFGFQASSEAARQAGAEVAWSADSGGWLVAVDEWMRTTVPGLSAAGELTGQWGADAAIAKGTLAGLGLAVDLGVLDIGKAHQLAAPRRSELRRRAHFARLLNRLSAPPAGLAEAIGDDDTIICRCEAVTQGALRQALAEHPHLGGADAVKLLTRIGMGRCQGRLCHRNAARIIARARGRAIETVAPFTAQLPLKPVPLGSFATGPESH